MIQLNKGGQCNQNCVSLANVFHVGESTKSFQETNRKSFQINVLRQPLLLTKARNLL